MPHGTKIATCCYCGTRAALVLRGDTRHELSCSSCGAPLHDMKMLRADVAQKQPPTQHRPVKQPKSATGAPFAAWDRDDGASKRRKPKKRKTLARRFFEEAIDVIEDIFD